MMRAFAPNGLAIDPVAFVYRDMIQTLQNSGYSIFRDLVVAPYDWRLPVAPATAATPRTGKLNTLTAARLTDGTFEFGVDYLTEALKDAAERWFQQTGQPLTEVHYVGHSMGGLVGRSYVQSAAYGQTFSSEAVGRDLPLPLISNFMTIGTPHQGAAGSWNAWHDNFIRDAGSRLVLSKVVNHAFQKLQNGHTIQNPDGSTVALAPLPTFKEQKIAFVRDYGEAIQNLLPTYDFAENFSPSLDLNGVATTENENHLLSVLNANDGVVRYVPTVARNMVVYGTSVETPESVREQVGDIIDVFVHDSGEIVSFDSITARDAFVGEKYFEDVSGVGDGTVPLTSSEDLFKNDGITELFAFSEPGKARPGDITTSGEIAHTDLMSNNDVQTLVRNVFVVDPAEQGAISALGQRSGLSLGLDVVLPILTLTVDPVEAIVVDSEGNRLGFTQQTGPLQEIPGSVYLGGADGIGWVGTGAAGPFRLVLTGLGEQHFVQVTSDLRDQVSGIVDTAPLGLGATRTIDIPEPVQLDQIDLVIAFENAPEVTVGQDMPFHVSAANLGPETATDVQIQTRFDQDIEFISGPEGTTFDNATNTVRIPVENLAPSANRMVQFTVKPLQAGDLTQQAILGAGEQSSDLSISNNVATLTTLVDDPIASAEIVDGDLVVMGTNGDDEIRLKPDGKIAGQVKVQINGELMGSFAPTGIIRVDSRDGNDDVRVNKKITTDVTLDGGPGDDFLRGGGGNDLLLGGGGNDELRAALGNDSLEGGSGDDLLRAGDGDDLLDGGIGNDELRAHLGNDTLIGGDGNDLLRSGQGSDQLFGGDGNDDLRGHRGSDLLDGGAGNGTLRAGKDSDTLRAGPGNDLLVSGEGDDVLQGGDGDDELRGHSGNDVLDGGAGNDTIRAGSGDDLIRGGDGDDFLHGGGGNDIVLGEAGNDHLDGKNGRDLLIGGLGADLLRGGGHQEVLIAGTTDYDNNDAALRALLAEWTRPTDYATRVHNITSGGGSLAGLNLLLNDTTVHEDEDEDILEGNGGRDLFFYNFEGFGVLDQILGFKKNGSKAETRIDIG